MRAKVLYVILRTDKLFPPSIAPGVMQALKVAGVDARYYEIDKRTWAFGKRVRRGDKDFMTELMGQS